MKSLKEKIEQLEAALSAAGFSVVARDRKSLLEAPRREVGNAVQVRVSDLLGPWPDVPGAFSCSVARLKIDAAAFRSRSREDLEDAAAEMHRKILDSVVFTGLALPSGGPTFETFDAKRVALVSMPVRVFYYS